jgi:hypothetical protein
MKRLALFLFMCCVPALAQTINCPPGSFTSGAGPCQVVLGGGGPNGSGVTQFSIINANPGSLVGSRVKLMPTGQTHSAANLGWMFQKVSTQAFTVNWTGVYNGWNMNLILNNSFGNPSFNGAIFQGGAGCEGAFYQAFGQNPSIGVFAIEVDQWGSLTAGGPTFTYSSVQNYSSGQSPCNPNLGATPTYFSKNKLSTSPVALNSPATTINTTTGHEMSVTAIYDGSNLTVNIFDITAGGTCTPTTSGTCSSNTWSNINIPALVGGNTAWIGMGASTNANAPDLFLDSFVYNSATPTNTPPTTAWNANSTTSNGTGSTASPVFSIAPGVYGSAQTVAITDSTAGSNICFAFAPAFPLPNNNGGCAAGGGTPYTGPITISSTQTLRAMAGTNYTAPPSSMTAATYTIGTPTAATPTFSPAAGTYTSTQTVTVTDSTAGASIFCTTNGTTPTPSSPHYTGPFTVSSTQTIQCMATAVGFLNSSVGGGLYTISLPTPTAATPTFSPGAGTYSSVQTVTIASTTAGALITWGTTPSPATPYSGPVTVNTNETLYAFATASGFLQSATGNAAYVITSPTAATPVLSPVPPFNSPSGFTATLTCSTPSNTIYYTTDGSTPTTASNVYTGGISITNGATVLKALCTASGFANSAIGNAAGAAYTVKASTVIINKGVLNNIIFNN